MLGATARSLHDRLSLFPGVFPLERGSGPFHAWAFRQADRHLLTELVHPFARLHTP